MNIQNMAILEEIAANILFFEKMELKIYLHMKIDNGIVISVQRGVSFLTTCGVTKISSAKGRKHVGQFRKPVLSMDGNTLVNLESQDIGLNKGVEGSVLRTGSDKDSMSRSGFEFS